MVGNVASEVRFTATDTGVSVASFRVASTPRRYGPSGWTDGHTSYVTVKCWRGLADNVRNSVGKGQPVVVHGRQTVRPWERDGKTGTSVDIDADAIGHDLRWGTTRFVKTARTAEVRDVSEAVAADLASSFDIDDDSADELDERDDDLGSSSGALASDSGWAVPGAGGVSEAA